MLNTMVPVGAPQVGCVAIESVGTDGAPGAALIVTVEAALVMQVLSVVLRTDKV